MLHALTTTALITAAEAQTVNWDRLGTVGSIIIGLIIVLAGIRVLSAKERMSYGEMGREGTQRFLGGMLVVIGVSVTAVGAVLQNGLFWFLS